MAPEPAPVAILSAPVLKHLRQCDGITHKEAAKLILEQVPSAFAWEAWYWATLCFNHLNLVQSGEGRNGLPLLVESKVDPFQEGTTFFQVREALRSRRRTLGGTVITYLKGDATQPQGPPGLKIIAHVCNNRGGWGAGFVLAVSRRWPEPESEYRKWAKQKEFVLGAVQYVRVEDQLYVANMVAQDGYGEDGQPPLRYGALRRCLSSLERQASKHKASIHMPRIGCGLAGGDWSEVEKLIQEKLGNIPVFVYDFEA